MPHGSTIDVVRWLRAQIVSGALPAGSKIPTRSDLCEQFHARSSTVQLAIARLVAEGSLHSAKRAGTYVTAHPPERSTFVLAISPHVGPLWRAALLDGAAACSSTYPILVIPELLGHHDHPGWIRLRDILASDGIAGVLLIGPFHGTLSFVEWPHSSVPVAQMDDPFDCRASSAIHVTISTVDLVRLGVRTIQEVGCRRPCIMLSPGQVQDLLVDPAEQRRPGCLRHRLGLPHLPEAFIQVVEPRLASSIHQTMLLLLRASDGPDGVILGDDHFLAPALDASAALRSGTRSRRACPIIAYTNRRYTAHPMPSHVISIGIDAAEMLRQVGRTLISARLSGHSPQPIIISPQRLP